MGGKGTGGASGGVGSFRLRERGANGKRRGVHRRVDTSRRRH